MTDYNAILKRIVKVDGFVRYQQLFRDQQAAPDKSPLLNLNGMIAQIEHWEAKHPVKTYAQDFFEKFPNATRTSTNVPAGCWGCIYPKVRLCPKVNGTRIYDCTVCWSRPMEEEEHEQP
jgi:hypothetical protein